MKKLILEILIISMLALVPFATGAPSKVKVGDGHLVVAIIIDCSDVGKDTWNRSLILARQAMSLLETGDELILITAVRDRIVIETTCRIDPDNASQRARLNQKLMALKYKWWSQAKIADALQLARRELNNRTFGRKCCIVISDGHYSNTEVADIRNQAAAGRLGDINLLLMVTNKANQNLRIAGSRGEFDIAVVEKSDLAGWFEKIRPLQDLQPVTTQEPSVILQVLPVEPPPLTAITPPKQQKPRTIKKFEETDPVKPKLKIPFAKIISVVSTLLIIFAVIAACVWLLINLKKKYQSSDPEHFTDGQPENIPSSIIALYEGQKYDLGDETSINHTVIGTTVGSAVPINDDKIEPKHLVLFKKRGNLWARNLSQQTATINGLSLRKGQKLQLLLPCRISLTDSVQIELFSETSD